MKKVKLKLTYSEAMSLCRGLKFGEPLNLSLDYRYKGIVEASVAEVVEKLSVLEFRSWNGCKAISISYSQAFAITLYRIDVYSDYGKFVAMDVCRKCLEQILPKHPEILPRTNQNAINS